MIQLPPGTLGITVGDPAGIGPEILVKALARIAEEDPWKYLILGDGTQLNWIAQKLGVSIHLEPVRPGSNGRFFYINPGDAFGASLPAPGDPRAARSAVAALRLGADLNLSGKLQALITGPVSKEHIANLGMPFVGQTEFLSEIAGTKRTVMMLLGHDDRFRWLRVALATTHLPLRDVADALTPESILLAVERSTEACALLGLPRARIAVCGLNPHAGEGGKLGHEEELVIRPAVAAAREKGADVHGPFPADALFRDVFQGKYDAVVAMYHDQGLVPLKMVAFDTGVNWTLGLPFIRTSPDHGTAFDIAGKGIAQPESLLSAMDLARKLAGQRCSPPSSKS